MYPIWKQWIHICLWVWGPLNSDVLRLKLQNFTFLSCTHHCRWVTDPGDFKHHSWDRCLLKVTQPRLGRPAVWGKKLKNLYPTTKYYATHFLQELCSWIPKAELQNTFQASKCNFGLDLTQSTWLPFPAFGIQMLQLMIWLQASQLLLFESSDL